MKEYKLSIIGIIVKAHIGICSHHMNHTHSWWSMFSKDE